MMLFKNPRKLLGCQPPPTLTVIITDRRKFAQKCFSAFGIVRPSPLSRSILTCVTALLW